MAPCMHTGAFTGKDHKRTALSTLVLAHLSSHGPWEARAQVQPRPRVPRQPAKPPSCRASTPHQLTLCSIHLHL